MGLCIAFGAFYPEYRISGIWIIISAVLSGIFVAAAGYTVNDYYDIEIDRINKPERVLPSGSTPMSPRIPRSMSGVQLEASGYSAIPISLFLTCLAASLPSLSALLPLPPLTTWEACHLR